MSYSHISGYDLPNDRLRSVMRTETGPKLLAKDKLIEFKPTQTESFFKSTMSLLDKFDMLDMIEPDLWKWIPRSEIPSLIEKSQNSIQSNLGNVQFSSKAMKRDYTTQLFEIRENSSSSNSSYASAAGTPTKSQSATMSSIQGDVDKTLSDIQTDLDTTIKGYHTKRFDDLSEFRKAITHDEKKLPERFKKLYSEKREESVVWYNTKTMAIEDRDRRSFRFQIDDLIREKVKNFSYLTEKVIRGDFYDILQRMMTTHQQTDQQTACDLISTFFDGETFAKKKVEPLITWYARISRALDELKACNNQLAPEIVRTQVINLLSKDSRYGPIIQKAKTKNLSLHVLMSKAYIRADYIKDTPNTIKTTAIKGAEAHNIETKEVSDKGKAKGKPKKKKSGKQKGKPPAPHSIQKPCYSFQNNGKCDKGDKCIYQHTVDKDKKESKDNSKEQSKDTSLTSKTTKTSKVSDSDKSEKTLDKINLRVRPQHRECQVYNETGSCPMGDTCQFEHNGPAAKSSKATASMAIVNPTYGKFSFKPTKGEIENGLLSHDHTNHDDTPDSENHDTCEQEVTRDQIQDVFVDYIRRYIPTNFNVFDYTRPLFLCLLLLLLFRVSSTNIDISVNVDNAFAFTTNDNINPVNTGLMDSGTSRSMVPDTPTFRALALHGSYKQLTTGVGVSTANASANMMVANTTASFCISDHKRSTPKCFTLRDVLLVPGLARPLISVNDITNMHFDILFHNTIMILYRDGEEFLRLDRKDSKSQLYEIPLDFFISSKKIEAHLSYTKLGWDGYQHFHTKMGHINDDTLIPIYQQLTGLKGPRPKKVKLCDDCAIAKAYLHKLPSKARHEANHPLEDIYVDVVGPFRTKSIFGHRYFITIVSKYYQFYDIIPINSKSLFSQKTIDTIKCYERMLQPFLVTWLHADNALDTTLLVKFAQRNGIGLKLTSPYKSLQNGPAERANRTIYEGGQSLRHHAGMPSSMLIPACVYFVYIRNHLPKQDKFYSTTSPQRALSPREQMYRYDGGNWKNHLSDILPFGAECFTVKPAKAKAQGKTSYRGERGVIIGRAPNRKCWMVLSIERRCYIHVYDVVCNESIFPFRKAMELPPRLPTRYHERHTTSRGGNQHDHHNDSVDDVIDHNDSVDNNIRQNIRENFDRNFSGIRLRRNLTANKIAPIDTMENTSNRSISPSLKENDREGFQNETSTDIPL